MEPWYESAALLCSHITLVLAPLAAFYYSKGVDAIVLSIIPFLSFVYHLCQTGLFCVQPFNYMQILDHVGVWGTITYLVLLLLRFRTKERVILWLPFPFIIVIFGRILTQTNLLPIAIGGAFVFFIAIRVVSYSEEDRRGFKVPDLVYLGIALGILALALFFFIYDDGVNKTSYWWSHSIWHFLVGLAEFFIYLSARASSKIVVAFVISLGRAYMPVSVWPKTQTADAQTPSSRWRKIQ